MSITYAPINNNMAGDLAKFLVRLAEGSAGVPGATTSLAPPMAAAATSSDPARPSGAPAELKGLVGMWTGTMTGGADLRVRHDVTIRIFEEGGEIRWEGHRRWSTGESRGSGVVTLSDDEIVLSGQRRGSDSSGTIAVNLRFARRGPNLEGSSLGSDNRVYIIVLTRKQ